MKTLDLVTLEERQESDVDWYAADPDVMYPAALDYAQSLMAPDSSVPMYVQQHVAKLRGDSLPESAWDAARGPSDELTARQREHRAAALEGARLIFTAMLREQNGGPIGLHILKSDRWRL